MDNGGNTQLHIKSYMGTPSEVKSLLDARADVNSVNISGDTPLHLALAIVKPTKRTGGKTKKKRRRRRKSRKSRK